jgi:tRNA U34 5-methylaminomethyl-2-thiouridine-forming methyltransferase MnmC
VTVNGWTPERTEDGSWTLRHPEHGEACHSHSGAWLEARERYAGPCCLSAWTREHDRPLRLLDVGTGLGLNLAAALEAVESAGGALAAVTLECDPSVLTAMLAMREDPEHAGPEERWHRPVREALAKALDGGEPVPASVPMGERSSLRVVLGDARTTLVSLPSELLFDAVFLDPFSPSREPDLWEEPFLGAIADRMVSGARLSTYCARYSVRLGLARAGLRVGLGPRVGKKAEGTLASPAASLPSLPPRVERRLQRDLPGRARPILSQPLRERSPGID